MRIVGVFVAEKYGQRAMEQVTLRAGEGIVGDRHAQVGSPRQVLIVDQPSLAELRLQPGDLSENLLVDESPVMGAWRSGQVLRCGDAELRLTFPCEPCAQLEQVRPGLAQQVVGRRGWLAMVVQDGRVQRGDRLTWGDRVFPALAEHPKQRCYEFIARIPPGQVVRTVDLLMALGLARAYYRVLPLWLKRAPVSVPVHRIVARDGGLLSQHLPQQARQLAQEGTAVEPLGESGGDGEMGTVGIAHWWPPAAFYSVGQKT
jgi:alkylated DNA nucleotide flippase Atl1